MVYNLNKEKRDLAKGIYLATAYCIFLTGLKMNGAGAGKIIFASLMLFSFYFFAVNFYRKFNKNYLKSFSTYYVVLFILIIIYGVITALRDVTFNDKILTLFGNPYAALAWLTPIVFIYAYDPENLVVLNNISLTLIKIATFVSPVLLLVDKDLGIASLYWLSCLYFVPFFTWKYQKEADKKWVIIGVVLFLVYSYLDSVRTGFVQVAMHSLAFVFLMVLGLSKKGVKGKLKALLLVITAVVLFSTLIYRMDDIMASFSQEDKTDTRSFLYVEVFEDLGNTDALTFGKGPLGTYYSDYFFNLEKNDPAENGDAADRLTVEVGFLEILLKGGWVMAILFFMICIPAIIQSIFFSKNIMAKGLGLYGLCYLVILFILNIPMYSNVYIVFWIIMGFCASKRFRNLEEKSLSI